MKRSFLLLILLTFTFSGYSRVIKRPIPDKLVVLTFDDAPASHYSIVAPLLKAYGFGATFFVCEFPPNFKDSSKYMNWRQIKALDAMGFEVASHTRTHPPVSKLTNEQFNEELKYIEDKCDSLHMAKPVNFAYPGYDVNRPSVDALRTRGYKFARIGGSKAYDPQTDHPLLVPSWATTAGNKARILGAFSEARNGKIVVLTIHGVPDVEHSWVTISPELFGEYLKYLSENHYKVIALRDLEKYINVRQAGRLIVPDLKQRLNN